MSFRNWTNISEIEEKAYTCWSCDRDIASNLGYVSSSNVSSALNRYIYICPYCKSPSFFNEHRAQYPSATTGSPVEHLSEEVDIAYNEARRSYAASAYTSSALMCRKILMNVAVERGAEQNKTFKYYVDWLTKHHYVPPNSEGWIDHIRNKGNDATHEIPPITQEDAQELISFCEMVLKFIYEFPARAAKHVPDEAAE